MKKLVSILCVLMVFSMLVSCGGQGTITNNEPKTTTTKTEDVSNTKKTEQVVEVKTTKPEETTKIDEKKEQELIELMTIKNMYEIYVAELVKNGNYTNVDLSYSVMSSKILSQELKDKLFKLIKNFNGDFYYGYSKFKAILDLEIEKHKLP